MVLGKSFQAHIVILNMYYNKGWLTVKIVRGFLSFYLSYDKLFYWFICQHEQQNK